MKDELLKDIEKWCLTRLKNYKPHKASPILENFEPSDLLKSSDFDLREFLNKFEALLINWIDGKEIYQKRDKDRKLVPVFKPFKKCNSLDEAKEVKLQLFLHKVKVEFAKGERPMKFLEKILIYRRLLKKGERPSQELEKDLMVSLQRWCATEIRRPKKRPGQTKGESTPLSQRPWWSPEDEKLIKLYFSEQIFIWLQGGNNILNELDLEKNKEIEPFDEQRRKAPAGDKKWIYTQLHRIFDHIKYAYEKDHEKIKASWIRRKLSERFHMIEPVSTLGKLGSWKSRDAELERARSEYKLIRKLEGQKDLERKLMQANQEVMNAANNFIENLRSYIEENQESPVWRYMIRNPDDTLWNLLSSLDAEEFEYFVLVRKIRFGLPERKQWIESNIRAEILNLWRRYPDETLANIAERVNQDPVYGGDGVLYDAQKVRYLLEKEKKEIPQDLWENNYVHEAEINWRINEPLQRVLSLVIHKWYLPKWREELKKEVTKQKKSKEWLEKPEPPASFFSREDFAKDEEK